MPFSSRLAELVRRFHRLADDVVPSDCSCTVDWDESGAILFTCRPCMTKGLDALEALVHARGLEGDQPDLFDDLPEYPGDVPTALRSESRR